MRPDAPIGEAEVGGEAFLSRKTEVVLPRVAEQHREGYLVARTQLLGLEEKIRDLGEAHRGRSIRAFQDDVLVFQNVAQALRRLVVHGTIVRLGERVLRSYPLLRRGLILILSVSH